MAHLLQVLSSFRVPRRESFQLLASLLIGSLFGALCAKTQTVAFSVPRLGLEQASEFSILFRAFVFPCFLAVPVLLRRKALFYVLFFLKGFFVSFTLCVFALQGLAFLRPVLPATIFQSLLLD